MKNFIFEKVVSTLRNSCEWYDVTFDGIDYGSLLKTEKGWRYGLPYDPEYADSLSANDLMAIAFKLDELNLKC